MTLDEYLKSLEELCEKALPVQIMAESRTAIPLLLKLVRKYRKALSSMGDSNFDGTIFDRLNNAGEALAYDPREEK